MHGIGGALLQGIGSTLPNASRGSQLQPTPRSCDVRKPLTAFLFLGGRLMGKTHLHLPRAPSPLQQLHCPHGHQPWPTAEDVGVTSGAIPPSSCRRLALSHAVTSPVLVNTKPPPASLKQTFLETFWRSVCQPRRSGGVLMPTACP